MPCDTGKKIKMFTNLRKKMLSLLFSFYFKKTKSGRANETEIKQMTKLINIRAEISELEKVKRGNQ